ncbi:hypothetical protein SAMN04487851_10532 [Prevotella sp. tc2-28]|nr:hypothetical protein SAMN04487851_10532 [Prevotella sp. tc2-28]
MRKFCALLLPPQQIFPRKFFGVMGKSSYALQH